MQARSPLFLALDAGTTSFKALLVDAEGQPLGHERAEIRLRHPGPLAAEVDAEDWWRAAVECVPRLLNWAGVTPDAIAAVGVTGAMHALVPVGADGAVLAPTLTWFDQRCRPQAQRLRDQHAAAFEAVGGVSVFASSARLRWLRETAPAVIDQTRCFLLPKDFLRFRLTGRFATDASDARNTSLVDRGTGDWCRALIEAVLEVPTGKLPEIQPGYEIAGPITGAAASALGLPEGTQVAVGMGDVPCTLLGVNAFRPGQLALYLGTGLWMARTLATKSDWEPRTAWAGSTLAGGSAFLWARRLFQPDEAAGSPPDYGAIEQALASVLPGAGGLLFLPHLMGERGRCGDPDARGVFFGLTLAHTPAHLQRAVVEGIAFQVRREIEAAAAAGQARVATHPEHRETTWQVGPEDPITLSGAAARSEQWRRIIADVTGRPVTVPAVPDTTALGAALVAAVAVDHFSSPRAGAAAWVRSGPSAQPSEAGVAIYEEAYERFRALAEAVQPLYQSFAETGSCRS